MLCHFRPFGAKTGCSILEVLGGNTGCYILEVLGVNTGCYILNLIGVKVVPFQCLQERGCSIIEFLGVKQGFFHFRVFRSEACWFRLFWLGPAQKKTYSDMIISKTRVRVQPNNFFIKKGSKRKPISHYLIMILTVNTGFWKGVF